MKKNKIGDIYYNPIAGDLWFLNKIWSDEEAKEVWTLNLINDDLKEQLKYVKGFIKIGNIYDMINERQKLIEYLKEKIKMYNEIIENLQLLTEIEDEEMGAKKDLHIWGETLFQNFQQKMLEILDNKGE